MRKAVTSLLMFLVFPALLCSACTSTDPSDQEVLSSLTDGAVVPAYRALAQDLAELDRDVAALCSDPSDPSLRKARDSWRTARASWMRTRAMGFGPVMERRSVSLLDWSPTDTSGIEELLTGRADIDAVQVQDALASNRRGFGAVEFLLFRDDSLTQINTSPPYCSYLASLAQVGREEAGAILSEWTAGTEERGPYRDYFTNRSPVALLPIAAVEEVVRTQVFLIRNIVHMRLASALGLREGGADLSAIPGNAADTGLEDLRQELLGIQAVYEGVPGGMGISDLVKPLSADTDQRMKRALDTAISAIDATEGPLRSAIADRPEQVEPLYQALSDLQQTLSTEVVSLLGVSVGFSDADGDSSR